MNINLRLIVSVGVFGGLIIFSSPAHAYIDPGTGSMLIQTLIAVVAAIGVSIGVLRNRIKQFFCQIFGKKKN